MKWVLVIAWISFGGHGAGGSGVEISTWPTLKECFAVGEQAQGLFQRLYSTGNSLSFNCIPSTGGKPTCGGSNMDTCK